jgi:hypothetical protein
MTLIGGKRFDLALVKCPNLLAIAVCFVRVSRYVVSVGDSVGGLSIIGAEARFGRESAFAVLILLG